MRLLPQHCMYLVKFLMTKPLSNVRSSGPAQNSVDSRYYQYRPRSMLLATHTNEPLLPPLLPPAPGAR